MKEQEKLFTPEKKEQVRVGDYILEHLVTKEGVDTAFGMTGGAIANVLDSFERRRDIEFVPIQHEQAAAMAVEAYAKLHPSRLGVAFATSGPGGINLLTGVHGCYADSVPSLFITGNVGRQELKHNLPIRQLGFQETDIVAMMKPITKYSVQLNEASNIRYELEKAIHIARSGRPGPVHIDIPVDLQYAQSITTESLVGYQPFVEKKTEIDIRRVVDLMSQAERPVLIPGAGIRLSGAMEEFKALVRELNWPVLPSWAFKDCLPDSHPLKIGFFGVYGNRGANFAVQNADFILAVGTRLDSRMTGGQPETFAREAIKVIVDIEKGEMEKGRVKADLEVVADANQFLEELRQELRHRVAYPDSARWLLRRIDAWRERCQVWKLKYPHLKKEHWQEKDYVNPYVFAKILSDQLGEKEVVVADCGGNLTWMQQGFEIKKDQRFLSSYGNSPMGYALPAAMGASLALKRRPVVCVIGDGGMQINIQELQTIVNKQIPVKIFVANNSGYGIIRQFQDMYLEGRHFASQEAVPDFVQIAQAYGIQATNINTNDEVAAKVHYVLSNPHPFLCEVKMSPDFNLEPKLYYGKPIEEISPDLPEEEFMENMIVPLYKKK